MGLDQVIEEVLAEGQEEADAIIAEAEEEADEILEEAREKARSHEEETLEEAREQAEAEKRRVRSSAELEAKKKRLDAESDVLATIRSRVEARLSKLPDEERTRLLRTLVEESGADEFGEGAKAWARQGDREILEKMGFDYEGEIDCIGGAVIETPDAQIREDLRFDSILDEIWREQMHEVAIDVLEG